MAVKVLGIKELQSNIKGVNRQLAQMEDPAERAAGEVIKDAWEVRVPFKDGHYRRSLAVGPTKKGMAVGVTWLPDLPREEQPVMYAKRLEFGDSARHPQPSMRPALEASRAEATAAAGTELSAVAKGRKARRKRTPKAPA
jgi:HK97 gp10 family phage protein